MKKALQQGKLLFKILGALAGIVFIVFGMQERSELSRTLKIGKHAVVEPITQYTEFKKSGSTTYTAEFRFKTDNGQQMVVKHSFPEEVLAEFKANRPVEIAYMPSDPSSFVFVKQQSSWTLVLIGGALFVAALLLA
ncbi:DUF3592 domain-containing protein [Acidovorax sp. ACV01]|uniref:DUF3592 domain-containing protein n=1 Tax=Acidovorax sp. ACV01 TaxID=2769311 RepID=UPI001780E6E5|nr:DUF3592 domain-containing protein [Acidovorax sp. ACV01]MBD9392744.1 hypothetical protein [Acidovorax sp. ACV01]